MKKWYLRLAIVLIPCLAGNKATAQNVEWAHRFGGTEPGLYYGDQGMGIATDASGNAITVGYFSGAATFRSTTLTATGFSDGFVSKQDANGTLLWAKRFGGADGTKVFGVATDAAGNIYTTGQFYGSADFGGITIATTSTTDADIFVCKQDASGNVAWVKNMGGIGPYDNGCGIAVDRSGNIYTTGYTSGRAKFGTDSVTTNNLNADIFICKQDPSGNVLWVHNYGGTTSTDIGNGIAIDEQDNIYVTGAFQETANFGSVSLSSTNNSQADAFIVKLNSGGSVQWAVKTNGNLPESGYGIATSPGGYLFATGSFRDVVAFGAHTLTTSSLDNIFVTRIDQSNGAFMWAKSYGNTNADELGRSIAADASGNVYVTGSFYNSVTFKNRITAAGESDAFVIKMDAAGNNIWDIPLGGTHSDIGYGIATHAGTVYTTGVFFSATARMGSIVLNNAGGNDIYVAKINQSGVSVGSIMQNATVKTSPNPASDMLLIDGTRAGDMISITDLAGRTLLTVVADGPKMMVPVREFPVGNYLLHIRGQEANAVHKITVNR